MPQQPDGGPAFPGENQFGMTLRDYFAGQVIAAVVETYAEANGGVGVDHLPRNCAIHAYRIADAMLEQRRK